ncbi:MAG: exodeoxyribonuclease V subunit gamma, partial [Candidatus Competibacter sp.]|nr:exodeoxyribonuclease V subunit gamma [Candidatus Competibacter sp.]
VYRPDWIQQWEAGGEDHWQAELWRRLARSGEAHRVQVQEQFRAALAGSAREVMRGEGEFSPITPALRITPTLCLSSSSRSVMIRMRASGSCSSSHLAMNTMRMLLPLPWVCQTPPPSSLAMRSCAAFTPAY